MEKTIAPSYVTSNVPLNFALNETASWIGYSLDGEEPVTVISNMTLTELPYGSHNMVVYAKDSLGNMGASEIIFFEISEPFPTELLVAASAA